MSHSPVFFLRIWSQYHAKEALMVLLPTPPLRETIIKTRLMFLSFSNKVILIPP